MCPSHVPAVPGLVSDAVHAALRVPGASTTVVYQLGRLLPWLGLPSVTEKLIHSDKFSSTIETTYARLLAQFADDDQAVLDAPSGQRTSRLGAVLMRYVTDLIDVEKLAPFRNLWIFMIFIFTCVWPAHAVVCRDCHPPPCSPEETAPY